MRILAVNRVASSFVGLGLASFLSWCHPMKTEASVLVETESFAEKGGWVLDQQFMDQMGSPFLLAHGLGRPVAARPTEPSTDPFRKSRRFSILTSSCR